MRKRILSLLLCVVLLCTLLPTVALAASSIDELNLSVAGTKVNSSNQNDILNDSGSVKAEFDPDSYTLNITLTNADINTSSSGIYVRQPKLNTVITLVGDNKITTKNSSCISCTDYLTIKGDGTLELNSSGSMAISMSRMNSTPSRLTISGVKKLIANRLYQAINVIADFYCENSNLTVGCTETYNEALNATGDIYITGGSITATAPGEGANGIESQGGSITLTDVENISATADYYALCAENDIIISASTMKLKSNAYHWNCLSAIYGTLTIKDGSDITAESSYPAIYAATAIDISDSTVNSIATDDYGI